MKHFFQTGLYAVVLALLFIVSCKSKPKEITNLSEGIPGEVMVVGKEDELDALKTLFAAHFELPDSNLLVAEKAEQGKYENIFSYYFIRDKAYDGTEKNASSIIVWNNAGEFSSDLDDLKEKSTFQGNNFDIKFYENIWAKPQLIAHIITEKNAADEDLKKAAKECVSYFQMQEKWPGNLAPNAYCDSIKNSIKGAYGFSFDFTPQFRLEFRNPEVIWLRQETSRFYRDIFINIFSDSLPIDNLEKAVENRNSFSKKYLKNEEGTPVTVSRSKFFPCRWEGKDNHGEAVLRGWYQEEMTFRRGPFVRYFFHDVANKRYVALDQFVYAPDMARNQFYRTFELIANTFKLEK